MPSQLKHEQITGSLFSYWADQFPLDVTTIYPGMQVDTSNLEEWLELWIDGWSRRPGRSGGRQLIDLTLTIHCFVQPQSDKSRIHALADAVRSILAQQTVPLYDHTVGGAPLVGYASLFEAETRDLTRQHLDSLRHAMQHLVVICRGIAQDV